MRSLNRREFIRTSGIAGASMAIGAPMITIGPNIPHEDAIKVGVIGTGARGVGLIRLIQDIQQLKVIACCDILPFRLEEGLIYAPKAKSYANYKKLLEDKDVDAVIIATPLYLHTQIAIDALGAEKHIYCEKTMAYDADQTYQLLKATDQKTDLIFQVGHQYHSSRLYRKIVDLIRNDQIGTITGFECQWNRNGNWRKPVPDPKLERQINWRMYSEYSCGLLAELSAHQIDFVNWATQSHPIAAVGTGGIDYWKDGRETFDNVHVIFDYPEGIKASFTCTTANAFEGYQIKVMGDKATIIIKPESASIFPEINNYEKEMEVVDGVTGATSSWGEDNNSGIVINIDHIEPTEQALIDFALSIIKNETPISNVKTGADVSFSVQMALEAMRENRSVHWNY